MSSYLLDISTWGRTDPSKSSSNRMYRPHPSHCPCIIHHLTDGQLYSSIWQGPDIILWFWIPLFLSNCTSEYCMFCLLCLQNSSWIWPIPLPWILPWPELWVTSYLNCFSGLSSGSGLSLIRPPPWTLSWRVEHGHRSICDRQTYVVKMETLNTKYMHVFNAVVYFEP